LLQDVLLEREREREREREERERGERERERKARGRLSILKKKKAQSNLHSLSILNLLRSFFLCCSPALPIRACRPNF